MSAPETFLCAKYEHTLSSFCQPPSFELSRFGYTPSADEFAELRQDITSLDASLAVIDAADTDTSNYARLASHRAQTRQRQNTMDYRFGEEVQGPPPYQSTITLVRDSFSGYAYTCS